MVTFGTAAGCFREVELQGLQCNERLHDFGAIKAMPEAQNLRHVFVLQNSSRSDVLVKEIRSSCGCLVAGLVKNVTVKQGESFRLPVEFAVPRRPGRITKSLYIVTETLAPLELLVSAFVESSTALHAYPEKVKFGKLNPSEPAQRKLKVLRWDRSPLSVERIDSAADWLKVGPQSSSKEGQAEHEFQLSIDSSQLTVGEHKSVVNVYVTGSDQVALSIPTEVEVVPEASPYLESVWVDGLSPGSSRLVTITQEMHEYNDQGTLRQVSLVSPDPDLSVYAEADSKGCILVERNSKSSGSRLVSGKLEILSGPDAKSIFVDLLVWFDDSHENNGEKR